MIVQQEVLIAALPVEVVTVVVISCFGRQLEMLNKST